MKTNTAQTTAATAQCGEGQSLKTYKASFRGRQVGAIGCFYSIQTIVMGANKEQAMLNLYDRFEHIQLLKLEEVAS